MKIADSHTDFVTCLKNKKLKNYFNYLKNFKNNLINCAIFTTNPKLNLKKVKKLIKIVKNNNFIFSIEDLGFIKNKTELLDLLKSKPFSVTLTWNYQNQFAGGALSDCGISQLGKQVVKIIEDSGVLIDTAHMSKKTFYQFVKLTKYPIYNSHSNIYKLLKHRRNLTDKQISIIKDSKGFLGLTLYQKFISKNKIIAKDIAKQIDYLIKNFGADFFGFGTDFYGIDSAYLPTDISNYNDLDLVKKELKNLGYSNNIIENIFYNNYKNFIQKIKNNY